jgi:predicted flap endonuclease-1-like 5' DNA nuclease
MSQPMLEVLLWILLAFFVGCILGYIFRRIFAASAREVAREATPATTPAAASAEEQRPEVAKVASGSVPAVPAQPPKPSIDARKSKAEPTTEAAVKAKPQTAKAPVTKIETPKAANNSARPKGIAAPRAGSPDKLQRISGVGPKIELTLHRLGIFHFDQIAEWTPEQGQWVDDHLKFKGRIARDEWIRQAKLLANGKEEEFTNLYGNGVAEKKAARTKVNSQTRSQQR